MYLFTGIIHCLNCSGKYRGKKMRNKSAYICSTNSKDSTSCRRFVVMEEDLTYVVLNHLKIFNEAEKGIREAVERIDVKDKRIIIHYWDKTNSIVDENEGYGTKLHF